MLTFTALHELDYLKKGVSMLATNARESIRFIDRVYSSESINDNSKLILETPEEVGPKWKKCLTYKVRSPKIHEFPNNKTAAHKPDVIKYENQEGENDDDDDNDNGDDEGKENSLSSRAKRRQRAELPARLKYLLRPCIKKTHIDEEDWKLITEDLQTKIWCESFGIKCINLSEAESFLFHVKNNLQIGGNDNNYTLSKLSIQESSDKPLASPSSSSSSGKKRRSRSKKGNGLASACVSTTGNDGSDNTHLESYDSISYAPRGSGELWVP